MVFYQLFVDDWEHRNRSKVNNPDIAMYVHQQQQDTSFHGPLVGEAKKRAYRFLPRAIPCARNLAVSRLTFFFLILACFVLVSINVFPHRRNVAKDLPLSTVVKFYISDTEDETYGHTKINCKSTCDKNDIMCRPRTLDEWNELLQGPDVQFEPLLNEGQYIFPWERQYLVYQPLKDIQKLPDLGESKIVIDGGSDDEVTCDVGQRLLGRVDLHDGYGEARMAGLDEVRAWMVGPNKQRAVVQVTDIGNGSYSLGITCLWPGSSSKLYVSVSYPREFIRAAIHQINAGATRFTAGKFKGDNGMEEITPCNPTPNIPGRYCICNYTSFNGREFYCGRPLNPRLSCSDWVATYPLGLPLPYKMTQAEAKLVKDMSGSFKERTLEQKVIIITSRKGKLPKPPKCTSLFPNVTWDVTSRPQGYWDKRRVWQSLVCQRPNFDPQYYKSCLKDTHVHILGDSNNERIYNFLRDATKSVTSFPGGWPRPAQARNAYWNITIHFRPHDYPLFLSQKWVPVLTSGSVESNIEAIPSYGRQIVILHYYLHLTPFHLTVLRSRLQTAVRAITRLLTRNPKAFVAFRGPHVVSRDWNWNHAIGGDVLGRQYMDIISEAFSGLENQVVFLEGWEMSAALENEKMHPSDIVPNEMVRALLAFICKK